MLTAFPPLKQHCGWVNQYVIKINSPLIKLMALVQVFLICKRKSLHAWHPWKPHWYLKSTWLHLLSLTHIQVPSSNKISVPSEKWNPYFSAHTGSSSAPSHSISLSLMDSSLPGCFSLGKHIYLIIYQFIFPLSQFSLQLSPSPFSFIHLFFFLSLPHIFWFSKVELENLLLKMVQEENVLLHKAEVYSERKAQGLMQFLFHQ